MFYSVSEADSMLNCLEHYFGIGAADTDGSNGVSLDDGSSVCCERIQSALSLGDGISETDGSVGVNSAVHVNIDKMFCLRTSD